MDLDDPLYSKLFARAPIYDLIFSCLSPGSLIRLARTCCAAYLAAAEFESRAFNVNRHFSHYFTDPIAFRNLQARTNTLVSGSNALQFLDRTFYPESDLDVYTHPGHSFEVAQFLVETEGYHFSPRNTQEGDWKVTIGQDWDGTLARHGPTRGEAHLYPMPGISGVWTFKKTTANGECLTVQIIEGKSSPLESILGFHSTCVMNFISSNAAYSLYPVATFENRSTFGMPKARSSTTALQKYFKRGWRVYFVPTPNDSAFTLNVMRWVSDKHTWRLPLDQTGIRERPPLSPTSAPLTFDPVLFNGWKLRRFPGLGDSEPYECTYFPLRSTLFRYNYALPDESLSLAIRGWAHRQGKFSHRQVSKEDWSWFDADIPGFCEEEAILVRERLTRI